MGADLAGMQLISKYNKGARFLLCVIDIFSKYPWVAPVKDKKGVTIVNPFQKILDYPKRKANKIWIGQVSELYNNSFKKWLDDNDIKMCSTYNKQKSVVAKKFVRTLKNKVYKHMTTVPKSKIGDHVRISKYKKIFAKGYAPNWSEEVFVINKIKNAVPWSYVISDLSCEEIVGTFYEKELQKTNQKQFRLEKIIKRKENRLYIKWKSLDNSFNSWIDKKDIV